MICPDEIASEVSALQAARVGEHGRHVLIHAGRDGADDEGTGSDFAGAGEEDHVVAGGRDHRGSATGRCGAGMNGMKSLGSEGCLIGGGGSRRPRKYGWRWWRKSWGCIGKSISI